MKKTISFLFVLSVIAFIIFSCSKSVEEKLIYQNDTIFLKDTIFINDTIQNYDTLFVYDTIIHTDTIVLIDTIIIQDTNEFAYLFQHHELKPYEIVFYTRNKLKDPYEICVINSDNNVIQYIDEGSGIYPIWSADRKKVVYVDLGLTSIVEKDIATGIENQLCPIDRNVMFLRHFRSSDMFLVTYYENNKSKIGAIDYHNNSFIELTSSNHDERNPNCSDVDDWIYFSRLNNETYDIYRKKLDGSVEEEVYIDTDFNLSTFSVSSDGKFLITPKHRDGFGYIVFYDIKRKRIILELRLPVDGHPLYASLSGDNKAIFFVNGTPFNYSEPRNIYMIGLDGTQLLKMTNFIEKLAIRPLVR